MKILRKIAAVTVLMIWTYSAQAVPITLNQLPGLVGGAPALTGVYQADLNALGINLASVSISDNSGALGRAVGQFSGFDLDAIVLSTSNCANAACVAGLAGLAVFDFSTSGTFFTPGTQRAPSDPKLFGTDASGLNVDDLVATLGAFDGNATTAIPGADGFISMGDNGILSFNLTSLVSTAGLFLYIGEVGDNGEVAAGTIEVSDRPVGVPEPGTLALLGIGLVGMGLARRRKKA